MACFLATVSTSNEKSHLNKLSKELFHELIKFSIGAIPDLVFQAAKWMIGIAKIIWLTNQSLNKLVNQSIKLLTCKVLRSSGSKTALHVQNCPNQVMNQSLLRWSINWFNCTSAKWLLSSSKSKILYVQNHPNKPVNQYLDQPISYILPLRNDLFFQKRAHPPPVDLLLINMVEPIPQST